MLLLVEIGLTDLPKSWGGAGGGPPAPTGLTLKVAYLADLLPTRYANQRALMHLDMNLNFPKMKDVFGNFHIFRPFSLYLIEHVGFDEFIM